MRETLAIIAVDVQRETEHDSIGNTTSNTYTVLFKLEFTEAPTPQSDVPVSEQPCAVTLHQKDTGPYEYLETVTLNGVSSTDRQKDISLEDIVEEMKPRIQDYLKDVSINDISVRERAHDVNLTLKKREGKINSRRTP